MGFKISWKRRFFWHTKKVLGITYIKEFDKMHLSLPGDRGLEIPEWSKCHVRVGKDWIDAAKANMEQQAGQTIPIRNH